MTAVREVITMSELRPLIDQAIANTTPVNSPIIDTAGFSGGVGFYFGLTARTSGDFTLTIEHGDEANLSDAAEIEPEMYVSQRTARRTVNTVADENASMVGVGCFSTKRFVRAVVTGANTPNATAAVNALLTPEIHPAT